jgi:ATP-dependent Lhr-like helicase
MEEKFKAKKTKKEIIEFINAYLYIDKNGANAIYEYFKEQFDYVKEIPNDKKLVVEHYTENDKKFVIFHSLCGRRVNDVLSRVIAYAAGKLEHRDIEVGISDNGFYLASNKKIQVMKAFGLIKSKNIYDVAKKSIENTEILKRRFRHCATRALMILRQYKGVKKKVGRQQVSSGILLNAVKRINPDFSILKEARREVLEDLMDIENAKKIIENIENGKIKIKEIFTSLPSPFAFNLVLEGYTDVLKMEEKIEFLKRMHNMVLAKIGKNGNLA